MKLICTLLFASLCLGCGYGSSKTPTPPQAGVVPAISALVPNTANSGDPQFTLTVNGTNFAGASVVNWNGAQQTTTHVTAGQVTATIPASAIATPGMVTVTVTNPSTPGTGGIYGTGGTTAETSNSMTFTIN